MKTANRLTIETHELRRVLEHLCGVPDEYEHAVLRSVLVEGNQFTVKSPDVEITATANVLQPCDRAMLIPFCELRKLTKQINEKEISIAPSENLEWIDVMFGSARARFESLVAEDFARFTMAAQTPQDHSTQNTGLIEALRSVRFATSEDETRYYLQSVCFSRDPQGEPCVVATNGHILAWHPIAHLPKGAEEKILHKDAVKALVGINGHLRDVIFQDGFVSFFFENLVIKSRLIPSHYPHWHKVVPTENKPMFSLKCGHLTQAINQIRSIYRNKRWVGVELSCHNAEVRLFSELENKEFETRIPVTLNENSGDIFDVGFSELYLQAVCDAFKGKSRITFAMHDSTAAATINADDSQLTIVLMPRQTQCWAMSTFAKEAAAAL